MLTPPHPRATTLINADISGRVERSIRIAESRIAAIGAAPQPDDRIVDLQGDSVLPGLINAHDHLQLNNLPCLESPGRYAHVREWISDINARLRSDAAFQQSATVSLDHRLAFGGLKNLLSGVTTVAHHDPYFAFLSQPHFPVRVISDCGWSHSLYLDGEVAVRSSYRRTPREWPWIIHASEGCNREATDEFERLDALGCLGGNTLIVHGIALDGSQRQRLAAADAGLIWCPTSNLRLFGRTAEVAGLLAGGRIALGTDSRLSGARDLLDELRVAQRIGGLDESALEPLVTSASARLLRLADRGVLNPGARADILVLPARMPLSRATRADVRLVLIDGIARYGDRDFAQAMAPHSYWAQIRVDGRPKILDGKVAGLLSNAGMSEPGVELSAVAWRAA
jgi:cytosine/adenosine deaminase-related metal-dependent hydrolase